MYHTLYTFLLMYFCTTLHLHADILRVGENERFADIVAAAAEARAGDTIYLTDGVHRTQQHVIGLHGTATDSIVITCSQPRAAVVRGGVFGLQLTQCSFVRVENILFEMQTRQGMLVDDIGPTSGTSNNIELRFVHIERGGSEIGSVGLRFIGVDYFDINACVVRDGAWYVGIDLVGCHRGAVRECIVSGVTRGTGVLTRAGSQFIDVVRCSVTDCSGTGLYLGGVSNAQDFRPRDAGIECADVRAMACVVSGCATGVAFDGSERSSVVNTTIVGVRNVVFTLGTSNTFVAGLRPSTDNRFVNNIVAFSRNITAHVAIMAGTSTQSHVMSNNLWYNVDVPAQSTPNLMGLLETESIYGANPLFVDPVRDFRLREGSPAIGKGVFVEGVTVDHAGKAFVEPRSIGAYQYDASVSVRDHHDYQHADVNVHRVDDGFLVDVPGDAQIDWYDISGRWLGCSVHSAGRSIVSVRGASVWRVQSKRVY